MANTKNFKVNSGIQPAAYHENVGTVTSGSVTTVSNNPSQWQSYGQFSTSSQDNTPTGVYIKPDGTKMYLVGSQNDTVFQYSLSTAWDVTTASYDSVSKSISAQETIPFDVFFKSDGTSMYIIGQSSDAISQYTLSTAWDVSTASYSQQKSVSAQGSEPRGLYFKSDGLRVFTADANTNSVFSYTLSTAWDISTASYDSKSLNTTASGEDNPMGIAFNQDGTFLYVVGDGVDNVLQYELTTAYDLSTATLTPNSYVFGYNMGGMFIKPDDTKVYLVDYVQDAVTQITSSTTTTTNTLDLSTGSVFEITPTSDIQINLSNPADSGTVSQATLLLDGAAGSTYDLAGASYTSAFSVASQEATPSSVAFKSDGTKMYVIGYSGDDVNEYALSTSWDITTASFTTNFSVSSQSSNPTGITFKTDGTSFYITDSNNFGYQYDMSTAWDVSTASYASKSHDFTSQAATPYSIKFKSDGTKMYIANAGTDDIYQYSLSTAWDISTGSYDSVTFAATDAGADCRAVEFKSDGTKMYIVSNTNDAVYQYSLSTAWDISSASYDSVSFSVTSQETTPTCVVFGNSGTNMYVAGFGNASDNVFQYSTGSSATITYDTSLQWGGGTAPDGPAIGETDVLTFTTRDGGTTYQAAIAIDGAK